MQTAVGDGATDTAMSILERVKSEMATLKTEMQGLSGKLPNMTPLYDRMEEMARDINELASRKGFDELVKWDPGALTASSELNVATIKNMQNEIEELKATLELVRQLADKAANEPVITTWMESE